MAIKWIAIMAAITIILIITAIFVNVGKTTPSTTSGGSNPPAPPTKTYCTDGTTECTGCDLCPGGSRCPGCTSVYCTDGITECTGCGNCPSGFICPGCNPKPPGKDCNPNETKDGGCLAHWSGASKAYSMVCSADGKWVIPSDAIGTNPLCHVECPEDTIACEKTQSCVSEQSCNPCKDGDTKPCSDKWSNANSTYGEICVGGYWEQAPDPVGPSLCGVVCPANTYPCEATMSCSSTQECLQACKPGQGINVCSDHWDKTVTAQGLVCNNNSQWVKPSDGIGPGQCRVKMNTSIVTPPSYGKYDAPCVSLLTTMSPLYCPRPGQTCPDGSVCNDCECCKDGSRCPGSPNNCTVKCSQNEDDGCGEKNVGQTIPCREKWDGALNTRMTCIAYDSTRDDFDYGSTLPFGGDRKNGWWNVRGCDVQCPPGQVACPKTTKCMDEGDCLKL